MSRSKTEYDDLQGSLLMILFIFAATVVAIPCMFLYQNYKYEWICVDRGIVDEIVSVGSGKYPSVRYRLMDTRVVSLSSGYIKGSEVCVEHKKVEKQ